MRISRTIGESKTGFKADNSNEIKRKILSVGKNKRSDEIASLADELKRQPCPCHQASDWDDRQDHCKKRKVGADAR